MSLVDVVATGNRIESLRTLRDRLAGDLDECRSARDVAALSQRLMDVLVQIEAAEKAEPDKGRTALDELANRRKAAGRPNASRGAGAASRAK